MKAAVCREFGKPLVIEEITLAAPGPQEIKIRLKACAICHSDVSYMDGIWGGQLPAVYGHEGAGVVEAVGPDVDKCKPGDHVIVTLIRHCGQCYYCTEGHEVLCETHFPLHESQPIHNTNGEGLYQALNSGAFAQGVLVHQSQVEIIPQTMQFDVASLLACGVLTGWGAVKHASDLKPGQHAVIIGCGGVGINSIQAAANSGAASVIALDLSADKRSLVKEFGATHAIDPSASGAVRQVFEITGERGADFVYVTVGSKRAIESASSYITKNGTIVVVGMPGSDVRTEYDPATLANWSQKIVGTKMGSAVQSRDIPELISLYESGDLKLEPLISRRFQLEEINEAIDAVRRGEAIKNVIVFE